MVQVTYNTACRSCLKSNGLTHAYHLSSDDREMLKSATEYRVMKIVEKLRKEDGHTCDFCSSENVEIMNVVVEGQELYSHEQLVGRCQQMGESMLQIHISKSAGNFQISPGGSPSSTGLFIDSALSAMMNGVKRYKDDEIPAHSSGHFFACVTGGVHFADANKFAVLERLSLAGISRKEVHDQLQAFYKGLGL